jgi:hypothetical protein
MLAMGITGIVLICMAIMRDILRTPYLSPYFKARELATKTQLDVIDPVPGSVCDWDFGVGINDHKILFYAFRKNG